MKLVLMRNRNTEKKNRINKMMKHIANSKT